jgi:hypothetical protein
LVVVDYDCAYGDFAVRFGRVGFGDGGSEVVEVGWHSLDSETRICDVVTIVVLQWSVEFEWDAIKAKSNIRKHGVAFEFAAGVFEDGDRIERIDAESSEHEERWATTGLVEGVEIYVVYAVRGEAVRLISARRASRYEREAYWNRKV